MKKFTLFLSAMLFSVMSMAGALGDGYSKVTDIATLAAGDKVVLYCDEVSLGVTGWDGSKDATVGANGWVEYVVENAENGVLLKDGEMYIAQPTGNHFKYADKGVVCTVSKDGKFTSNNRILYQQGTYYRMYEGKESDSNYKPFYVYEVTNEGGSSTPDDGGDDVTPDDGGDDVTPDDGGDDVTPGAGATFTFNSVAKQTKNGYTVTLEKGNGTNDPAYKDEWGMVRVYNKNTITIEGGQITSMKITYTKTKADKAYAEVTANVGTYISGGESTEVNQEVTDTWNGSAEKVVLTLGDTGQRGLIKLVINEGSSNTPDDGGDDTPDDGGTTPDTPVTGTEITGLRGADAIYVADAEFGDSWFFDLFAGFDEEAWDYVYPEVYVMVNEAYSKTAINGTYNVLYSEYLPTADDLIITDEYAEDFVGTLTIKNVDSNGNYSFKGSFTANDGKTYTFNQTVEVYAYSYAEEDGVPVYEEIILNEGGTTPENPDPENPETPTGEVTFDADVDNEGIGTDSDNATAYSVTKDGVTMTVSSGILGTYNNENHYRVYKNQTLTITSTVGNIVEVEFTCTANDDEKYGPGCFTVSTGDYAYSGAVGTWTGSAAEVVFTATTNQVRATEIVVKVEDGTAVDDVLVENTPVKVIKNGQMYIIRGEKTYNVLGSFVK